MRQSTETTTLSLEDVRGIISFPCCPKQTAVVSKDAHGRVSVQCANCGKFLLIDNDKMTATVTKPCKGAKARFRNAG